MSSKDTESWRESDCSLTSDSKYFHQSIKRTATVVGTQWCEQYHQHQICLRLGFPEVLAQLGPRTREVWFSVPQEHSCRLTDYKPWKQRPFPGNELYRLGA